MLAFSNDYYGFIFRVTQSVELFCTYDEKNLEELIEDTRNVHIPQELRIRSRGTERHSASN